MADHPVVNVSWEDAKAYADWIGKRLPTDQANFDNAEGGTMPVEHFSKGVSPFGIWDMCGNVSEWVNDWYDSKYYTDSPDADPQGPTGGHQKGHRGGGYHENRNGIRAKSRHMCMATSSQDYIGFHL